MPTGDPRLDELIDAARKGGVEEVRAAAAHLRRHPPAPEVLLALGAAEEQGVRAAVAGGLRGRDEPALEPLLAALAGDEAAPVRQALADAWSEAAAWRLPAPVALRLLGDPDDDVRLASVKAAAGRDDLAQTLEALLALDGSWRVREAAARSLAACTGDALVRPLLVALATDDDSDVTAAAAAALEAHLGRLGAWPADVELPAIARLREALERATKAGAGRHPRLLAWLEDRVRCTVDVERLASFGTDLTAEAEAGRLPRAFGAEAALQKVVGALTGRAPRAAVLVGEPGSGKTALVHELVERLRHDPEGPWRVLRVVPSELLVGTRYLGEWETRVQELISAASAPRRVLLVVPNLHELAHVGQTSKSDASVAGLLAPHVESGSLAILGESTPEAWRAGFAARPALKRLFRRLDLPPAEPAATRAVAQAVLAEAGVEAEEGVLERLQELAALTFPTSVEPGRTLGLLRDVLGRRRAREGGGPGALTAAQVLEALAASTGVPLVMLDDERPLDLDAVRAFFEARVRGQPEAVTALGDLVALVKAGVTDPGKPFGVLLFVGPTGVGKTELARALAELLFGDAARLKRFDMSEYATFESYERLIGARGQPGLLTEAVKDSPFSVFLFDEVEKAHVNVFDLFLQLFDAGRLTDTSGRTADFRRSIFLLTSNVGSALSTEPAVGFGGAVPPPPDAEATLKALRGVFRPELLGRLDAVVHFRPLSAETAEWIARREVARVLERSGLTRRQVTVDVDPTLVAFLLRRGWSPELGARPLKRTVERHVLLPVARRIAAGAVPPGSVLRLTPRRDDVQVTVLPSAERAAEAAAAQAAPAGAAGPWRERLRALDARLTALAQEARPMEERRAELLRASRAEGFWADAPRARRVLGEIHRWEGLAGALTTLERRVRDTAEQAARAPARRRRAGEAAGPDLEARVGELEREAGRIGALLACRDARLLADCYVTLTQVRAEGRSLSGVERLARMLVGLARRRGLEAEAVDDHRLSDPAEDAIGLLVTGAGAATLLSGEAGLHLLTQGHPAAGARPARRAGGRGPREGAAGAREWVRVEVLPVPDDDDLLPRRALKVSVRRLKGVKGRLLPGPTLELALLHPSSMTSLRAHTAGPETEALARLLPLLTARARAEPPAAVAVVRRYHLGPSPLVRDRRSGRQTGRLEQVLAGDLDPLA